MFKIETDVYGKVIAHEAINLHEFNKLPKEPLIHFIDRPHFDGMIDLVAFARDPRSFSYIDGKMVRKYKT